MIWRSPTPFYAVGLPRSKVVGREFMRRSGDAWLVVQAGWIDEGSGPVEQPLPMELCRDSRSPGFHRMHCVTKRGKSPSATALMSFFTLWMDSQGTRHKTLRTQMQALAACRLQLGFKGRTYNGQPVEQFDAWIRW